MILLPFIILLISTKILTSTSRSLFVHKGLFCMCPFYPTSAHKCDIHEMSTAQHHSDTLGSVLQCVAAYCSVLQRAAACCSVLQCVAPVADAFAKIRRALSNSSPFDLKVAASVLVSKASRSAQCCSSSWIKCVKKDLHV